MSPDDLTGEQAGATIRSRDDVEKVPGDKLEEVYTKLRLQPYRQMVRLLSRP